MLPELERYPERKKSVVFLLYKDGKVLLETKVPPEYSFHDPYAGLTIVPGGKIEQRDRRENKEFLNAAIREIREEFDVEAGLFVKILETDNNINPKGVPYHTVVYLVLDWDGEPKLDTEVYKARKFWIPIEEALNKISVDFGKEIIERARGLVS